jgi:hypothetical protein
MDNIFSNIGTLLFIPLMESNSVVITYYSINIKPI